MKNKIPLFASLAVALLLVVGVLYYFSTGENKGAFIFPQDGKGGRAELLSRARVLSPSRVVLPSTEPKLKLSTSATSPTPVANQNAPLPMPK